MSQNESPSQPSLAPFRQLPTKGHDFMNVFTYPRCSMYGLFTYIWVVLGVNVGKYTIHWASGYFTHFIGISQQSHFTLPNLFNLVHLKNHEKSKFSIYGIPRVAFQGEPCFSRQGGRQQKTTTKLPFHGTWVPPSIWWSGWVPPKVRVVDGLGWTSVRLGPCDRYTWSDIGPL